MLTVSEGGALGINAATGELLWTYRFRRLSASQNITTPVFHNGRAFFTAGHSVGGLLLEISDDLHSVRKVWRRDDIDNCHGGVVLLDGRLDGGARRLGGKQFFCVDFAAGGTIAAERSLDKMSLAYADGVHYGLTHQGVMYLIRVTPDGFEAVSRFERSEQGCGQWLTRLVMCGGRLYIRRDAYRCCCDVRAG